MATVEHTPESAMKWLDDAIEELRGALEACVAAGINPAVLQAKFLTLMSNG